MVENGFTEKCRGRRGENHEFIKPYINIYQKRRNKTEQNLNLRSVFRCILVDLKVFIYYDWGWSSGPIARRPLVLSPAGNCWSLVEKRTID